VRCDHLGIINQPYPDFARNVKNRQGPAEEFPEPIPLNGPKEAPRVGQIDDRALFRRACRRLRVGCGAT
jgi:hypothetical protein